MGDICGANKMGEFNMLKCFRDKGHTGPCNFCVVGEPFIGNPKGKKRGTQRQAVESK